MPPGHENDGNLAVRFKFMPPHMFKQSVCTAVGIRNVGQNGMECLVFVELFAGGLTISSNVDFKIGGKSHLGQVSDSVVILNQQNLRLFQSAFRFLHGGITVTKSFKAFAPIKRHGFHPRARPCHYGQHGCRI